MTPTAVTPAGREAKPKRKLDQRHSPPAARRVSGPLTGRTITAPPMHPRGPAQAPPSHRGGKQAPRAHQPTPRVRIGGRALAVVRALPDHGLLDRVVRGRAWIPILGVMLAGIVAMQVEVLGLSASMGRALERGTTLESRNQLLRASVASLTGEQRIERLAAGLGMVMPTPDAIGFLAASHGGDAQSAATNIHPPDSTAFLAALAASTSATTATTATSTSATTATTATSTPATTAPSAPSSASGTPPTGG
ncbi:MAG: hypothetical protein ACR2LV_10930 [Solirubrobacteraceae bacterium]